MKNILVVGDGGSELVKAMLAIIDEEASGDIICGDPIKITAGRILDVPIQCSIDYDMRQQHSFTPPHKKNRRDKFKRSGR